MGFKGWFAVLTAATVLAAAAPAYSKTTADDAARLGASLTPVGAEKAGNKDGSIPAWTGGMSVLGPMFKDYKAGDYYPDPFPDDKPLFKITHENYKQYAAKIPAGLIQMLDRFPDYSINIYASRRTALYSDAIYAATKANATTASLAGLDSLKDSKLGFPFPIPQSGSEVIWNHKVRYRGDSLIQNGNLFVVSRSGEYEENSYQSSVQFSYGNQKKPGAIENNLILQVLRKETAPPRLAGGITLLWDHLDGSRDAWQYSPGSNRVRQAPSVAFDNPVAGTDGIQHVDQADMFNGSMQLYDWKLIGKKEMYIGYNNYKLVRPELKYRDIIRPAHLNPDHPRYELHRVWVVEATLKAGLGNVLKRRTFYVDEDSWTIAAVDDYDGHDTLSQYQEGYVLPLVVNKAVVATPQFVYDLSSGRYLVVGLPNEQGFIAKFDVPFPTGYFTPQTLQKQGRD